MCKYCDDENCHLTKEQVLQRGPILESNAYCIMRSETDETPQTYAFEGVPAYNSLSAWIPDEGEENPHAYMRFDFDEDEGCGNDWMYGDIAHPLIWQTEKAFLERFLGSSQKGK